MFSSFFLIAEIALHPAFFQSGLGWVGLGWVTRYPNPKNPDKEQTQIETRQLFKTGNEIRWQLFNQIEMLSRKLFNFMSWSLFSVK
jgi:hypothetical protein